MEKYPNGLPSHFFREQRPKKDKKKKKKRDRFGGDDSGNDIIPASIKKQLLLAGGTKVSTRSKLNGESANETLSSGGDLTSFNSCESFNKNDNSSYNLTATDKSNA